MKMSINMKKYIDLINKIEKLNTNACLGLNPKSNIFKKLRDSAFCLFSIEDSL